MGLAWDFSVAPKIGDFTCWLGDVEIQSPAESTKLFIASARIIYE